MLPEQSSLLCPCRTDLGCQSAELNEAGGITHSMGILGNSTGNIKKWTF